MEQVLLFFRRSSLINSPLTQLRFLDQLGSKAKDRSPDPGDTDEIYSFPYMDYTWRFMPGMLMIILLYVTPVMMYRITPELAKEFGLSLTLGRTIPYRDNNDFFLNPGKRGYGGPKRYAEWSLDYVEKNSVIIADYTTGTVLDYYNRVIKPLEKAGKTVC